MNVLNAVERKRISLQITKQIFATVNTRNRGLLICRKFYSLELVFTLIYKLQPKCCIMIQGLSLTNIRVADFTVEFPA